MKKICRKCGHVNEQSSGLPLEACPVCGAIYSRVEAAQTARASAPAQTSAAARPVPAKPGNEAYLEQLRARSNYPAFRTVVGLSTLVGYLLAALAAIGAVAAFVKVGVGAGLMGLVIALLLAIMTRVGKEVSLMMADASDALVRMAALQDR